MYRAACKLEFQPFNRSYSQLTLFNRSFHIFYKKKYVYALSAAVRAFSEIFLQEDVCDTPIVCIADCFWVCVVCVSSLRHIIHRSATLLRATTIIILLVVLPKFASFSVLE